MLEEIAGVGFNIKGEVIERLAPHTMTERLSRIAVAVNDIWDCNK